VVWRIHVLCTKPVGFTPVTFSDRAEGLGHVFSLSCSMGSPGNESIFKPYRRFHGLPFLKGFGPRLDCVPIAGRNGENR